MTSGLLSEKEREFLQGQFDDKYYQYRANLRVRIQHKLEELAKDLPLIMGNERLNNAKSPFNYDIIAEPVIAFARASLDYDTIPVKAVGLLKKH